MKSEKRESDADPSSVSIEQAKERIHQRLPHSHDKQTILAANALGRVLAEAVLAPVNVPPFRSSAMDGYAFRHADGKQPLTIAGRSLAGHPGDDALPALGCQRITTGARVPDDADTVVQQENVSVDGNTVTINKLPVKGFHVRPAGSDSAMNDELLACGQRLAAAEVALLASHGITQVNVRRRMKVAVFSTGDELADPGTVLEPGCIYDANRPLLLSLLNDPSVEALDLGIVTDSETALRAAFATAVEADVIVSTGGVSVGDADFVRPVLEELGELHLWKIAMKPGRPLTFGLLGGNKPYFGLPGNPVSTTVTCLMFVLPALAVMLGESPTSLPYCQARLNTELVKLPGRVEYQRGILEQDSYGEWEVSTTGLQDSHVMSSLHRANCFIELDLDSSGAKAGSMINTIPFAHLGHPII